MKWLKPRFVVVLLLSLLITGVAWANGGHRGGHGGGWGHGGGHGHGHVGVVVGVPWGYGWYYPPPIYPYGAAYAMASPGYYIDQGNYPQSEQGWWYYCASAQRYYPYVSACPEGWQRVTPQPPPDGR
jgi:hypothetical protein